MVVVRMYESHREPGLDMHHIDIEDYLPPKEFFGEFIDDLTDHFNKLLFASSSRLQKDKIVERMTGQLFRLL